MLGPSTRARFDSLLSVLAKIRELGFAGFETGFRNLQSQADHPGTARQQIESSGLQFFGVHIFLLHYDEQTHIAPAEFYERVAETGAALGAQRLILSGAPALTDQELARKVEGLHNAGKAAKKLGLKLAYHNHDKEFQNGAREIQGLLRATDPDLVTFLVDAGHAFQGGADVPAFIEQNYRRIIGTAPARLSRWQTSTARLRRFSIGAGRRRDQENKLAGLGAGGRGARGRIKAWRACGNASHSRIAKAVWRLVSGPDCR